MWVFSTNQNGTTPYAELVPIGEMSQQVAGGSTRRKALIDASNGLTGRVHGNTGLYDTTLKAVEDVRKNYDPSKVNTVVLMTDGKNENPGGMTLAALLAGLKTSQAKLLPVPVFTIGIGPQADMNALGQISKATGGKAYSVKDPTDVRSVFLDAVVQRRCTPSC